MKNKALLVVIASTIYGPVAAISSGNNKELAKAEAERILAGANAAAKGDMDMRDAIAQGAAVIYAAQARIAGSGTLANIPGDGIGAAAYFVERFK